MIMVALTFEQYRRHTVTCASIIMYHILFRFLSLLLFIHDSFVEATQMSNQMSNQKTFLPFAAFISTRHEFNSLHTMHSTEE